MCARARVCVCEARGGGLHHPRLSSHHTPAAAVSRATTMIKRVQNPPSVRPGASWKCFNRSGGLPGSVRSHSPSHPLRRGSE